MLNLHTIIKRMTVKEVKQMGWKNISDFCKDLGIEKFRLGTMFWPGEPFAIDCSKEIQKELLVTKRLINVYFIVHGRLYSEEVLAYELGNCLVITEKEFDKLF